MSLSDKATQEFKDLMKKEYGEELTDSEARTQGERLVAFFDILYKQAQIEHRRKVRLKKEKVKGFFLEASEGPYTCAICRENILGNNIWWNLDGLRCRDCWRNIQKRVIPSLTYDSDDKVWVKEWQLQSDYGLHPATRGKLRREGLLRGRDLKRKDGIVYYTVYLVNENKEFFKKYPKKPKMKVKFIKSKNQK